MSNTSLFFDSLNIRCYLCKPLILNYLNKILTILCHYNVRMSYYHLFYSQGKRQEQGYRWTHRDDSYANTRCLSKYQVLQCTRLIPFASIVQLRKEMYVKPTVPRLNITLLSISLVSSWCHDATQINIYISHKCRIIIASFVQSIIRHVDFMWGFFITNQWLPSIATNNVVTTFQST